MWDLWWTKRYLGKFSPSTSVSTAKQSTDFSTLIIIIIIIGGWSSGPIVGLSNSGLGYTLPQKKKKI
jgi:hypothetical protein